MPKKREPYIAVELQALDLVAPVAALAGLPEERVGWGLVRLWSFAWRQGVASVPVAVLHAFVPGALDALVAFEFVRVVDGRVELRGMDRYRRVKTAQKIAASATNALRYGNGSVSGSVSDPTSPLPLPFDAPTVTNGVESGSVSDGKIEDRRQKISSSSTKKATRSPSAWEELAGELATLRAERLEELGLDPAPQVFAASRLNQLLRGAAKTLAESLGDGESPPEEHREDVRAVYLRFLRSAYWKTRTPPFPLEGFCSPKTLARCLALWGDATNDPVPNAGEWS